MNFDIAIHRLALSQSPTLGGAQLMIAKLRNDVELEQLRSAGTASDRTPSHNGRVASAFAAVAADAAPLAVSPGAKHFIDKLA